MNNNNWAKLERFISLNNILSLNISFYKLIMLKK